MTAETKPSSQISLPKPAGFVLALWVAWLIFGVWMPIQL